MKKRLLSLFLAFVTLLGILPTAALAANTEEEALGEVDIYNGGYELSYLTINGRIRTQDYTYFNYVDAKGQKKEVPAYCVNPNIKGVPQTVGVGESIKYLANERSSDPKVVGIISNGYPHRSLGELKLDNKYQAYYATKMALWCYLLPNWNIANLKVAPGLTGSELDIGNRILAAAKDMEEKKNLCAPIPLSLHQRLRTEQEQRGQTLSDYITDILREHFEGGARTMNANNRTIAFQVPEELFGRLKDYLAKNGLKQKDFILGLIERELNDAEKEE